MPFLSPSAFRNAWPTAMPVSSVVWCWSTCRSPSTFTSRSNSPWRANSSSMWSRKPTPVAIAALPVPSRARLTETSVSAVRRLTLAARMANPCWRSAASSKGGAERPPWPARSRALRPADEPDDVLHGRHRLAGDDPGSGSALREDRVDVARVGSEAFHLGADRPHRVDGEVDEGALEGRELCVAVVGEDIGFRHAFQGREDADEVVRLRPAFEPLLLGRQRLGIGLRLAYLLGDGVGVVGQVDA